MDISKASSFERFVFDLAGRDAAKMSELWRKVDGGGSFDLPGNCPALQLCRHPPGSAGHEPERPQAMQGLEGWSKALW